MFLDKNSIIDEVKWSRGTRSCVVPVLPGATVTFIADITARAINELAVLRKPRSWAADEVTVRTSYNKQSGFLEVSLTL